MMSHVDDVTYWWQEGNITTAVGDTGGTTPMGFLGNDTGYDHVIVFLNVTQVLFPGAYFLLAFVGLIGNTAVLFIIVRHPDMQTVTNYFIANLAITDIFTLIICLLPTALCGAGILPMGPAVCKAINYIQYVTVQATCCTLTAMSVDRYNLIVHAVRSRKSRTTTKVLVVNASIWAASFLIHCPIAIFSRITHHSMCETVFSSILAERVFHTFATLTMYLLPLSINLMCYISILLQVWTRTARGTESAHAQERSVRRKRKITRMVFVVVLLFAICWAPAQVLRMWQTFDYGNYNRLRFEHYPLMVSIEFVALCLAYSNSCVNPFVYAFTTTSFKKYFKKVFRPCCRFTDGRARTTSTTGPSTSRVSKVITREESSV
ncbi:kiSS-1 receptor-like [Patiria miniata]|uniref:G-protein coupled receptors family 1 profile domain-containing protein n=1 Tax=Patiria miniata TaxID=46514 RepID=A0A914B6Q6_PATMI|nr:kiSS-1 receptor-like [Patiria miniata]